MKVNSLNLRVFLNFEPKQLLLVSCKTQYFENYLIPAWWLQLLFGYLHTLKK
jgi:hypothetical protein